MDRLHQDLVTALPEGQQPPPNGFFEVVMCRDHCVLAEQVGASRPGGKPWDTVKPLGKYFEDLTQVVLVDDSPHKSLPEEASNMLVMPVWAGPDSIHGQEDAALSALVEGLLAAVQAENGGKIQDIRIIAAEISKTLLKHHLPPPEPTPEVGSRAPTAAEGVVPMAMAYPPAALPGARGSAPLIVGSNGGFEDAGLAGTNRIIGNNAWTGQFNHQGGGAGAGMSAGGPPPPGLTPSPPDGWLPRTTWENAGNAAENIGFRGDPAPPALHQLLLAKLAEMAPVPGATILEVNSLLQRRFPAAFQIFFQNSTKTALLSLVKNGILICHKGKPYDVSGPRYSLSPATVLPTPHEMELVDREAHQKGASANADMLVIGIIAELETRPGVPKPFVDAAVMEAIQSEPALAGWFAPLAKKGTTKQATEGLRKILQLASEECCAAGDAEMVGLRAAATPSHLYHIQITPHRAADIVASLPERSELVRLAAEYAAGGLLARQIAPAKPPTPKRKKATVPAAADTELVPVLGTGGQPDASGLNFLPVFEDRGALTAGVVPLAAAAADGAEGKREGEGDTTAGTGAGAGAATRAGKEKALSRSERKILALKEKLGLPLNCDLTRAQIRQLNREANKAKRGYETDEEAAAGPAMPAPYAAPAMDPAAVPAARPSQSPTPLHVEIMELAKRATPSAMEISAVQAAVRAVDLAARTIWPHARAVLFGSQATGLALPGGDLDIVVLGIGPQLQRAASGFTASQRRVLSEHLEDLLDALRRAGNSLSNVQIIDAKVPIIKCLMQTSAAAPALPTDISFGAANGAAAVAFLRKQIVAVPPLRPLTLVVKALLRDRGLNEVFTGGIGSYAIVNMVLAHLQREGYAAVLSNEDKMGLTAATAAAVAALSKGGRGLAAVGASDEGDDATFSYLQELARASERASDGASGSGGGAAAAAGNSAGSTQQQQANKDSSSSGGNTASIPPGSDLGMLLWSFLERFGCRFDFARQAVSVRQGGFVKKGRWKHPRKPLLLAVEDPQEPGKDICSGSYNIGLVIDEFAAAAQTLAEVCEDAEANELAMQEEREADAAAAAAAIAAAAATTAMRAQEDAATEGGALFGGEAGRGEGEIEGLVEGEQLQPQSYGAAPIPAAGVSHQHRSTRRKGTASGTMGDTTASMPMLSLLLDVECAVGRGPAANAARRAMEHRAEEARQAVKSRKRPSSGLSSGRSSSPRRKKRRSEDSGFGALEDRGPSSGRGQRLSSREGRRGVGPPPRAPAVAMSRGAPRGSKRGRAVENVWKDRRGQFMDYGDDGPDYYRDRDRDPRGGGGRNQEFSRDGGGGGRGGSGSGRGGARRGIKRKKPNGRGDLREGGPQGGGNLGPKVKKTKAKAKKKAGKGGKSGGQEK